MQEAVSTAAPLSSERVSGISSRLRVEAPSLTDWAAGLTSALLLILSFPNFEFAFLAWIALVPLLLAVARNPDPGRAFILGWLTGSLFFYASCYWLTYSMIHYGGIATPVAYLLLLPGALVVGLFPALFTLTLAIAIRRWGYNLLLSAPLIWAASEWARLQVTGQLWNALGYSQATAYNALLIQPARWGGVYLVSAIIVAVNASVAYIILQRRVRAAFVSLLIICLSAVVVLAALFQSGRNTHSAAPPYLHVVALQPNVPMSPVKTAEETNELITRHLTMSTEALKAFPSDQVPRLVIWPESPMNFTYASDKQFRDLVAKFATENHTSVLFNSLEPAPDDGAYNAAMLVNEQGRLIAQYDKIRLLPFGEYVPLPHWLPGASLITAIVGDFTPGTRYVLMPVGNHRAGVFICIESAYPWIARQFTSEGADVLINISNDGYLGPTAVMRQHLGNAVFRAVENGRPLLRVTNTGLTASIRPDGFVEDQTTGFQATTRTWSVTGSLATNTFYTKHGDVFAYVSFGFTIVVVLGSLFRSRRSFKKLNG